MTSSLPSKVSARRGTVSVLLATACLASGCYLSHERASDAGPDTTDGGADSAPDTAFDAGTDTAIDVPFDVGCDAGLEPDASLVELKVDLLFVVDDSGSMAEEQQALADQFPLMVRMLVTGDLDDDGRVDAQPVSDLRVGVITTNLGSAGFELGRGCQIRDDDGSDGVLRTRARGEGCPGTVPRFLGFSPGEGAVDPFVEDFACVAIVGRHGCGFEQPLEATLKALLPSDSPVRFVAGQPHGDGANAGFVRDDAVLAVVMVTDEDDCSIADPELYNPESLVYPWSEDARGNLRCIRYAEALQPVSRFVDAVRSVKESPDDLLISAITGVPPDLVVDPEAIDYDALLADPRMQEMENPGRPGYLFPACDLEGTGFAVPARRIVTAIDTFGENGIVQSICDPSFGRALRGITSQLGEVVRRRRCR